MEAKLVYKPFVENDYLLAQKVCMVDENGQELSKTVITERRFTFDGQFIKMLDVGDIVTPPQMRRKGYVRQAIEDILPQGRKRGCVFAVLHPFSYSYYNMFGFERVSDTVICDFPIAALDIVPRYAELVPGDESRLNDLLEAYNAFAVKRNLSLERYAYGNFLRKPQWEAYIDYGENGKAEGYLILEKETHFDKVNRVVGDCLHVWEIVFSNQACLKRLLGFLRMFEGELDMVRIHDIGMAPEVDLVLRNYAKTRYDVHPDIMARILDLEGVFQLMTWPQKEGRFSMRVKDALPDASGAFQIEYGHGKCVFQRLAENAPVDMELSAQALVRLVMGSDAYDAETVTYLKDVTLNGNAEDILRAFPKRRVGTFEHF